MVRLKWGRCGAEVPEGSRFCSSCGNQYFPMVNRKCPECGKNVKSSKTECPHCGKSLASQASSGSGGVTTGGILSDPMNLLAIAAAMAGAYFIFWGAWDAWTIYEYDYVDGWWTVDVILAFLAGSTCLAVGVKVLSRAIRR
ncbi:MAG: zinc-ribbon domain-containing protein [Thermoplasmata archaeon]|nr:zinc-ribbon domain-containing protein [Thermoplasmata archaeon]